MRICLAQINSRVGDFEGNRVKIAASIRKAAELEAELVIFPELALCGYPPEDLLYRPEFLKDAGKTLSILSRETGTLAAVVGYPEASRGLIFNSAALLSRRRIQSVYRKMLLPNYSVFDEKRYFNPGRQPLVFKLGALKVGVTVCEDIWSSGEGPATALFAKKIDLLINLSASPYYRKKNRERERIASALARRGRCFVAYCNLVGGQDELVFDGGSFVVSPKGKVAARAPQFKEDLLVFDLEAQVKSVPKPLDDIEEVFEALSLGLKDYAAKNGFQRALLGLSGGIDSAFVAALAVHALGAKNVMGISLPSEFSSSETRADARRVAENLKIEFREIPIQTLMEGVKALVAPDAAALPENIAEENLQARLRGNLLMYYSNKFGYLLLATGNKSEVSTGYCTLYGDMCGGLSPIKDVPKTLVYALSEFFNRRAGREVIPASVFSRAPTAELRPGQKDTDSLPPYPVLDEILSRHVEEREPARKLVRRGFARATVADVLSKVYKSEYKRRQAPPGIKITHLAFGKDWRMPISNAYQGGF